LENATKQERHLWYDFLRTMKPQFRRQVVIGQFIVDFYCGKAKLVIELDGSQHFEENAIEYDKQRTEILKALGCYVIRYTNYEIDHNFKQVCEDIQLKLKQLLEQ
jgi:very-short-patch-repair endonuclease